MSIILLQLHQFFLYTWGIYYFFYMVNTITMKKLLTLGALVASVALFAGCMNTPTTTTDTTTDTTIATGTVDTTTPTTNEVVPADTTTDTTGTADTTATPDATAE